MSAILCIIDGMTDEEFKISNFPNLRSMAAEGAVGEFITVPQGFAAESLSCIFTLLGYGAHQIPKQGRGWLEAVGADIPVDSGDLVLRASWASCDKNGRLSSFADTPPNCKSCGNIEYYSLGEYKAVVVLKGKAKKLSRITTHSPFDNIGEYITALLPQGSSELADFIMQNRTDNKILLPWGQSAACEISKLPYNAAAVASTPVVCGIAKCLGMRLITPNGANGETDTNLTAKAEISLQLAAQHELVVLHINGADEASHRKSADEKQSFLHRIDNEVFMPLKNCGLPVLITSDHGTSPVTGRHINAGQPFVLYSAGKSGNLGIFSGREAISLLKEIK
ncbi:MAG TPA: hypothetical protein DCP97_00685 [Ruminococcaceae bacterium]|nr:hypothetical protein [Oscillospiraceae bacterium]